MGNSKSLVQQQPIISLTESKLSSRIPSVFLSDESNKESSASKMEYINTIVATQKSYQQNHQESILEKRLKLSHPNLFHILYVQQCNQKAAVNNIRTHEITKEDQKLLINQQLYFEQTHLNLETMINERIANKRQFKEQEIYEILEGIVSCLSFFQLNNISHGDIHPSTIFFDRESDKFKLYDKELLFGKAFGLKYVKEYGKKRFLSPELIDLYIRQDRNLSQVQQVNYNVIPNYLIWKSDVFSLGMCILEALTLSKSILCYDHFTTYLIIQSRFQTNLQIVQKKYSPSLYNILVQMLEQNSIKRPDFNDLTRIIVREKFNNPIVDGGKQFSFSNSQEFQQLLNSQYLLNRTVIEENNLEQDQQQLGIVKEEARYQKNANRSQSMHNISYQNSLYSKNNTSNKTAIFTQQNQKRIPFVGNLPERRTEVSSQRNQLTQKQYKKIFIDSMVFNKVMKDESEELGNNQNYYRALQNNVLNTKNSARQSFHQYNNNNNPNQNTYNSFRQSIVSPNYSSIVENQNCYTKLPQNAKNSFQRGRTSSFMSQGGDNYAHLMEFLKEKKRRSNSHSNSIEQLLYLQQNKQVLNTEFQQQGKDLSEPNETMQEKINSFIDGQIIENANRLSLTQNNLDPLLNNPNQITQKSFQSRNQNPLFDQTSFPSEALQNHNKNSIQNDYQRPIFQSKEELISEDSNKRFIHKSPPLQLINQKQIVNSFNINKSSQDFTRSPFLYQQSHNQFGQNLTTVNSQYTNNTQVQSNSIDNFIVQRYQNQVDQETIRNKHLLSKQILEKYISKDQQLQQLHQQVRDHNYSYRKSQKAPLSGRNSIQSINKQLTNQPVLQGQKNSSETINSYSPINTYQQNFEPQSQDDQEQILLTKGGSLFTVMSNSLEVLRQKSSVSRVSSVNDNDDNMAVSSNLYERNNIKQYNNPSLKSKLDGGVNSNFSYSSSNEKSNLPNSKLLTEQLSDNFTFNTKSRVTSDYKFLNLSQNSKHQM